MAIGNQIEAELKLCAVREYLAGNAILYWVDETGVSNCEIVERGFSPKGRPPVLAVETKRRRVNMISAVSSQGRVRFMRYQDTIESPESYV